MTILGGKFLYCTNGKPEACCLQFLHQINPDAGLDAATYDVTLSKLQNPSLPSLCDKPVQAPATVSSPPSPATAI